MTGWITFLTFTPLAGALAVALLDREKIHLARGVALAVSFVSLALAVGLWWNFDAARGGLQFSERHAWIPAFKVEYFVGVDGLSLLMVLLSAFVVPFALLASGRIQENAKSYYALMLFLQAGLFGAFTALNFVHWFVFWELTLIPAYFLIKLWGGPNRVAAATQFFIYTLAGSVAMLLAFQAIYLATDSFDFVHLGEMGRNGDLTVALGAKLHWGALGGRSVALLVFGGVLFGFAVKVPMLPFHTWLPAAYSEAPSSVTMVLTGVMSKMGVYGFLRILLPLFPEQMRILLTPLLWLAVATIVFSALAACAQKDLKRMLAYSSINHLGYCLLGIFALAQSGAAPGIATEKAAALNGVLLQMFNHGLTAAALFYFVGLIEARSGGVRGVNDFGGLRQVAPVFTGLMGIALFASLGLPGLNGFVGEFLIFKGVFALKMWAAVLAVPGLLVTAIFLLTILQKVFSGPLNEKWRGFADLTASERAIVLPATVLIFVIGLWPQLVIGIVNNTVIMMVRQMNLS